MLLHSHHLGLHSLHLSQVWVRLRGGLGRHHRRILLGSKGRLLSRILRIGEHLGRLLDGLGGLERLGSLVGLGRFCSCQETLGLKGGSPLQFFLEFDISQIGAI
jgi:hypothetical protein